jgi:outer membrane protein assembly factor BamA
MRQAEKLRFTVRRVTFVGTTYTRYEVLNARMINLQEGDLFSRRRLVNSLRSMSKLRNEIYSVKLSDVGLRLNESDRTLDMTICFKPKRL